MSDSGKTFDTAGEFYVTLVLIIMEYFSGGLILNPETFSLESTFYYIVFEEIFNHGMVCRLLIHEGFLIVVNIELQLF